MLPAATAPPLGLQATFALLVVVPHQLAQGAQTHAHFAGHLLGGELFFQTELNRFAPDFKRMGMSVRTNCPPRRRVSRQNPIGSSTSPDGCS